MYKGAAAGLRRATGVHKIAAVASPSEEDFILTAANMSLREVEHERAQLKIELTRCEQNLGIAKRQGDKTQVDFVGHQKSALCARLSLLKQRRYELVTPTKGHAALAQALRETLSQDALERVWRRQREIEIMADGAVSYDAEASGQ